MKEVNGIYLPDSDTHFSAFPEILNKGTYQKKTLDLALSHVTKFRNALDIGAHVGLWSMHLVKKFECVHAFEPILDHLDIYLKNVSGTFRINMCALGDHEHDSWLQYDDMNTGATRMDDNGDYTTKVKTLDSFNIHNVDFIKIDCEGYEEFVCKGGKETILRDRPVICVEQKKNSDGVKYLESLGYKVVDNVKKDFILK